MKANQLGIEYLVTGSFAMSPYGEIRFTCDIDIVVELTKNSIGPFIRTFESNYYVGELSIRRAVEKRSMFNVINHAHGLKSCIVMKDTEFGRRVSAGGGRRVFPAWIFGPRQKKI